MSTSQIIYTEDATSYAVRDVSMWMSTPDDIDNNRLSLRNIFSDLKVCRIVISVYLV